MSSGRELSAVVFDQHVQLTLILVILSSGGCLKDKVYNSNTRTEELKENIRKEIANIPAEQLQMVNQNLFGRSTCTGTAHSTPLMICELQLLHSDRYRLTGVFINRQNPYAPRSRRCTGRREPVNKRINLPVV
jgi:hypothetical protein